jgi:hypothetical protein
MTLSEARFHRRFTQWDLRLMDQIDFIERLRETLPAVFLRSKVSELTGGIISSGYLANLDSLGKGPPKESFGPQERALYERESFVDWLKARNRKNNPPISAKREANRSAAHSTHPKTSPQLPAKPKKELKAL